MVTVSKALTFFSFLSKSRVGENISLLNWVFFSGGRFGILINRLICDK